MANERGSWGSNIGFLLAAIGSAVGLGNIWGFPYKMGKSGGFTFLIAYLLLAVFVGFVVMVSELAMGRKVGKGVIGLLSHLVQEVQNGWAGWRSSPRQKDSGHVFGTMATACARVLCQFHGKTCNGRYPHA